jgi:hypothetical protein
LAEQHEMVMGGLTQSGAEEWFCPSCGRRLLLRWRPFETLVLERGDEAIAHAGAKGGASIGAVDVRPAGWAAPPDDVRWLHENGVDWGGRGQSSKAG